MEDLEIHTYLPKLPRVLKKREAAIDLRVRDYLLKEWTKRGRSYGYELKIKGNKVKIHQKKYLNKVNAGAYSFRFSDSQTGKIDFDGGGIIGGDALIVVYDSKKKEIEITILNTGEIKTVAI